MAGVFIWTLTANTKNLIEDGSCSPAISGDPVLGPLGDYGGPSVGTASNSQVIPTLPLLPGSPALDSGNNATCATTDQRGQARFNTCDVGAFESQGFSLAIVNGDNQSTLITTNFAEPLAVTVTANNPDEPVGPAGIINFVGPLFGTGLNPNPITATTTANGLAISSTATANSIAGSYQVAATAGNDGDDVFFNLTNLLCLTDANVVTNDNDSGPGSLRYALVATCSGGTVTFADDYTIYLDSVLSIDRTVTIDASGFEVIVSGDSGNNGSRDVQVFNIDRSGLVTLTHLNVVSGTANQGGGIANAGELIVNDSSFIDNVAALSGYSKVGGGIFNRGQLSVNNSSFVNNSAVESGGGIHNMGFMTISGSTFSGNSTGGEGGAAIHNSPQAVDDNGSSEGAAAVVTNSTIANNSGDGIYSDDELTVNNSTIYNNSGNGLSVVGPTTMSNSIAGSNAGGDCSGSLDTNTNNLIEDGSCSPDISGDPLLASLGNYGGETQTLALLPGSPAVEAGDNATCESSDQRGIARPQNGACDLGAFESQGFNLSLTGGNNQSTPTETGFAQPLEVTITANAAGEPVGSGLIINFTAPTSGASLNLTSFTALTNLSRTASTTVTASSEVGSYTVVATATGISNPVTFSLTNTGYVTLALTKTVTLANTPPAPGEAITYTIELENSGNEDATNVSVQDSLPAMIVGSDLDWTGTVTANEAVSFTIGATITADAGYGTIILNTATYNHISGNGSDTVGFTTVADTSLPDISGITLLTPRGAGSDPRPAFDWTNATDSQSGWSAIPCLSPAALVLRKSRPLTPATPPPRIWPRGPTPGPCGPTMRRVMPVGMPVRWLTLPSS